MAESIIRKEFVMGDVAPWPVTNANNGFIADLNVRKSFHIFAGSKSDIAHLPNSLRNSGGIIISYCNPVNTKIQYQMAIRYGNGASGGDLYFRDCTNTFNKWRKITSTEEEYYVPS